MRGFFEKLTTEWWGITLIVVVAVVVWVLLSALLYRQFFKRFYDVLLSGVALVVLSPILIVLTIVGAVKMKGNREGREREDFPSDQIPDDDVREGRGGEFAAGRTAADELRKDITEYVVGRIA